MTPDTKYWIELAGVVAGALILTGAALIALTGGWLPMPIIAFPL